MQTWPSRKALAVSVRMQERSASHLPKWKPLVALGLGEGY